jgi:phenylacetate-CoA ligase
MPSLVNDPARSLAELERGLREVPVYARWRAFDLGDVSDVDARFAAMPETGRTLMREHAPRGFVPASADLDAALARADAELVRTSGTTGPPVTVVWSQAWWDASERASWSLNTHLAAAATGEHREAILASPRCVGPYANEAPITTRERTLGRLLFLNEHADVARWDDALVRRMAFELAEHAPPVLEGEPAYLAAFCARAEVLGLTLPRPRVVVLTYTVPSKVERARIARSFGAPIVSSYGSTETGYVLIECEHGRMHHNAASCRVDFESLGSDDVGRLLVTPFGHPFACFLKFDIGDLARRALEACPCGRAGDAISRVEGRIDEVTGPSGRMITFAEVDDAIAEAPASEHIVSYQLSESGDAIRVRATADGPFDAEDLTRALSALYGPRTNVTVERALSLVPEPSGKYARVRR